MSGGIQLGAPVNDGHTGLAIGSVFVAIGDAGSRLVQQSQLIIVVVPLINGIIDLGCNGEFSSKSNIAGIGFSIAEQHTAVNGDHRAIAGRKLLFTGNFLTGGMVDAIPGPQTHGKTYQRLFASQSALIGSGNGNRNHIFNGMNVAVHTVGHNFAIRIQQNVLHLVAGRYDHLLQLPGVGSVQLNIGFNIGYRLRIRSLNVHIVNGIVLGHFAGIIVSVQIHGTRLTVYRNRKLNGFLHTVAQIVSNLKGNGMCAVSQGQIIGSNHLASGHRGIHGIAVQEDLGRSGIQAGRTGIGNGSAEGCAAGGQACTVLQSCGNITGCILDVGNGGQLPVIHCGGVVQRKIIEIEGQIRRCGGLDIETDEARLSAVAAAHGIHQRNIILGGNITGGIDPAGRGDIILGAGIQILFGAACRSKIEMILRAAYTAGGIALVYGQLHSHTRSALGDVDPHTEGGCVLAVGHVTQNTGLCIRDGMEEHIIRPAGKLGIGVIQRNTQSVVTVLHLAIAAVSQEYIGVSIFGIVAVGLDRRSRTCFLCPGIHFIHTQEIGVFAVFKAEYTFRALAVGNLQHARLGGIGGIGHGNIHTCHGFVRGGGQLIARQRCRSIVTQGKGIRAVHADSPAVVAVCGFDLKRNALAIGDDRFLLREAEAVRMDHIQNQLANNIAVVDSLNGCGAGGAAGGKDTVFNGAHSLLGDLVGHIGGNIHGKLLGVLTDDLKAHRGTGCNVLILCFKQDLVKNTGGAGSGHQDHGVDGGALCAVGGHGAHNIGGIGGTLGNEGGGAAAVTVDRIDTTQSQHHFAHFIVGQATGDGITLTAVHMAEDQRAVRLDTDHRPGRIRRGALHGGGLQNAVLHQPSEVGGDGSPLIAGQRRGHGPQLTVTLLVNGQVGLCAGMHLGSAQHHTVPNHIAVRCIGVVGQRRIHSANNVVAHVLVVGNGLGQFLCLPVLGLIQNTVQCQVIGVQLVDAVVTGHNLDIFIGGVNRENMDQLTVGTGSIVQGEAVLLRTGCQIVHLFLDDLKILAGNRGVIQSGFHIGHSFFLQFDVINIHDSGSVSRNFNLLDLLVEDAAVVFLGLGIGQLACYAGQLFGLFQHKNICLKVQDRVINSINNCFHSFLFGHFLGSFFSSFFCHFLRNFLSSISSFFNNSFCCLNHFALRAGFGSKCRCGNISDNHHDRQKHGHETHHRAIHNMGFLL